MKRREDLIGGVVGIVIAAAFLAAVASFGYQVVTWLKTGVWVELPISRFVSVDPTAITSWKGVQTILAQALTLHIVCLIIVIGWIGAWGVYYILDDLFPPSRPDRT